MSPDQADDDKDVVVMQKGLALSFAMMEDGGWREDEDSGEKF